MNDLEITHLEQLLKGGKRAQIGEVRQWGKHRFVKRVDGWYYADGPYQGKKMGTVGGSKGGAKTQPKTDSKPRPDSQAGKKETAPGKDTKGGEGRDYKPSYGPTAKPSTEGGPKGPSDDMQRQPQRIQEGVEAKPTYSITELTKDVLTNRDGKKFRGFSTGLPSKVPYKSPEGTDTNLVGYVAFGKASLAAQEKLNTKLQNSEILLSEMGIRFKTPVDFVCQSMKATANEAASYSAMANYDVNHRIDIRHDTAIQKSLLHEIGHAIDYSMGPTEGSDRKQYLSHAVLEDNQFEDLKQDLSALEKLAQDSPYYKESRTGKFGKYLREKTEVFARGFEVLAYKKTRDLVEAGKLQPEALEDFTPDFVKAAKDQVPKDLTEMDPELKKLSDELDELRPKLEAAYMAYYAALEEEKGSPSKDKAAKKMDEFRTLKSKQLKIDKKMKPLRRKARAKMRANVKLENADQVIDQVAAVMERILSKGEFRKALLNVDLIGSLMEKLSKSDKTTRMRARQLQRQGKDAELIDYIQSVRQRDSKLASEIYDELYPKEGRQDTDLAGVSTPRMEKSEPKNKKLYERVKSAAKRKFDVYPSAYANAWLVQEYKRRGGTYKSEPTEDQLNKSLDEWFKEQWVDIGRKKKDGSHPECGRSDADKGKYPKCVPRSKASKMSDDEKESAVRRKRRAESSKDREGKKPINVATKVEKSEGEAKKPLNKPMRDTEGGKKFKVYVKDPKTGNTKTVRFGDANMEIKRDDKDRRKNFRARHNCDDPGPKTKAKYWSCKMWSKKKVSNLTKSLEDILKAKTVTRNGKQYYAEGPNQGKEVGTVRGVGGKDQSTAGRPQGKPDQASQTKASTEETKQKLEQRAQEVLKNLEEKPLVDGRNTTTGKPMVLNTESARQQGYESKDYDDAAEYHLEQSERAGQLMQRFGISSGPLNKLRERHRKLGLAMNAERVRMEDRRAKATKDSREDRKRKEEMKKAQTEMAHLDARSLDTSAYAKDREEALKSGWLERLHRAMEGFSYGDLPRQIGLDEGSTLHLVQVDDGMYTGFIKKEELVRNEETGQIEPMADTAKVRLDRMTLAEIPNFLMAKEYISPVPEPEPEDPEDKGYVDARFEELEDVLEDIQDKVMEPEPSPLAQKIRILELIDKLTSR